MAVCRAVVARVNSASVFVSTSVYGRPCRRVWCRTGSPAKSIWVCTCRRPSVASGHSKIRRDREPRNVPSVSHRSHRHPVHAIDQSSSSRCGREMIAASRCAQSRATASSPAERRVSAERSAGIRHSSTVSPYPRSAAVISSRSVSSAACSSRVNGEPSISSCGWRTSVRAVVVQDRSSSPSRCQAPPDSRRATSGLPAAHSAPHSPGNPSTHSCRPVP